MSITRVIKNDEQGATVIMVATMMLLLLGMAALVIDIGFAMNERRQDQTAADVSVMAGALELAGTQAQIIAQVKDYATNNVDATITDADWLACANPQMDSYGPNFTALSDGLGSYPCISAANNGYLQVRVPRQTIDTTFGRVLGVNQLTTDAFAIAQVAPGEGGGILPFGLTSGAGSGVTCLRTGPGGTIVPPCNSGPVTGNFFIIDSPHLGNPDMGTDGIGTSRICNGQGQTRYASNLALGMDHLVAIHSPGGPLRADTCSTILPANQLYVQPGTGTAPEPGLISNTTYSGMRSRLQQGTNAKRVIRDGAASLSLDNRPLWSYLTGGGPACAASQFVAPFTEIQKQANMGSCITSGNPSFSSTIAASPRLVQVPKFEEATWPSGASELRTIASFEAVYINALYFNCNGTTCGMEFYPGEGTTQLCDSPPASCKNASITQIVSYIIPAANIPLGTFPNNGPLGSLNVADPRMWR